MNYTGVILQVSNTGFGDNNLNSLNVLVMALGHNPGIGICPNFKTRETYFIL